MSCPTGIDVASTVGSSYEQEEPDALHIATFDPPTVLALIDQIERLQRENSTLADLAKARHGWNKKNRTELKDRLEQTEQAVARVREAMSNHPRACDEHPDDDVIKCGWKRAVTDVQRALDGDTRG